MDGRKIIKDSTIVTQADGKKFYTEMWKSIHEYQDRGYEVELHYSYSSRGVYSVLIFAVKYE